MAALTIFLGSFLLFLVQPLVGNMLLPVFGGTSAVWLVCLVTFQVLLVGGYFYAHVACGDRLRRRTLPIHCAAILLAGVLTACVAVKGDVVLDSFGQIGNPAWGSLCAVVALVGFPYILLSANTSLVQILAGGNYRLYAVSNAGSLCGLMSYPFLLEPILRLGDQWLVFSGGLVVYAVMLAVLGWRRGEPVAAPVEVQENRNAGRAECGAYVWFLLSGASSLLLNAVTAHLSSDVAPLPLLWTLVLAAYLGSWIIAFTNCGSKALPVVSAIVLPLVLYAVWHSGMIGHAGWLVELGLGVMIVFMGGWVVHASLYHSRPSGAKLTAYYLQVALGGACGGLVASLLLPALFDFIVEYPVGLAMVAALCVWSIGRAVAERWKVLEHRIAFRVSLGVFAGVVVWGIVLAHRDEGAILKAYRNFYGVVRVLNRYFTTTDGGGYWAHVLKNSGTDHGFQLAEGDWKSRRPTAYFGSQAGGLAFLRHPKYEKKEPVRAAVCGLGIGALAAYARSGDFLRFYEINPAVAEIASNSKLFSFVSDAEGSVEVVIDDARKALEKERTAGEKKYDILVVDVFSGDAIPPQMITKEAFALYLDRLEEDGILALHISSWHLDLLPVVKAAANRFSLNLQGYRCMGNAHSYRATWVFLSRVSLPDYYNKNAHIPIDFDGIRNVDMPEDELHPLIGLIDFFGRRQKE